MTESPADYFLFLFVSLDTNKMPCQSITCFTCEQCLPVLLFLSLFLIENRFFSDTIHPNYSSPPSTPPGSLHLPFPLDPLPLYLLSQKEQTSMRQQANRTKQDAIRQGESPRMEAGQGNLIGGKQSQEQAKESAIHLFLQLRISQKHKATVITCAQRSLCLSCMHFTKTL